MSQFIVHGGQKLNGVARVGGAKNAVLPILAGCILAKNECVLKNVPDISDVRSMLKILEALGAETKFENGVIIIRTDNLKNKHISHEFVSKMRASILLLGPLLGRFGEVNVAYPGGCVLGKRPVDSHIEAFEQLGVKVFENKDNIHLKVKNIQGGLVVMPEMSVTATENIILASVLAKGTVEIHLAAQEPHVQDLCHFLNSIGARISGIGTSTLVIDGVSQLIGGEYTVTSDYLELGTLAIASLVTGGEVTIENAPTDQLEIFWYKLWKMGAKFDIEHNKVKILRSPNMHSIDVLKTSTYPGFPTDLQAPFSVLLTQCKGETMIFETLFEGRLNYLAELEQMGANVQILNPHQAKIIGPTPLKGIPIISHDIRAGAAMVIASLCAEGETQISNIVYIDRGYEKLDEKLRMLGARIERV